jgi:hypothetical protein
MATRLQHWRKLEGHAKAMIEAMDAAARDKAWSEKGIEDWGDIYHALLGRPRLTLAELDRLATPSPETEGKT